MEWRAYHNPSLVRGFFDRFVHRRIVGGYIIPRPLLVKEVHEVRDALRKVDGPDPLLRLETMAGKGPEDAGLSEKVRWFEIRYPELQKRVPKEFYLISCDPNKGDEMAVFQVIYRVRDEYKVFKTLERIFAEDEQE